MCYAAIPCSPEDSVINYVPCHDRYVETLEPDGYNTCAVLKNIQCQLPQVLPVCMCEASDIAVVHCLHVPVTAHALTSFAEPCDLIRFYVLHLDNHFVSSHFLSRVPTQS